MGSFSGLGIGLSFLFGFILMGIIAELYYLFYLRRGIKSGGDTKTATGFAFPFRWKKICRKAEEVTPEPTSENKDLEVGTESKDSLLKGFGEESVEAELMRLHNLCGPPRFLFTIKEETKEDLESEDGKSRGGRSRSMSLNDLIMAAAAAPDTPRLSPMSSPPSKSLLLDSYSNHGFNPLFESSTGGEIHRLRSSPPPKFKFLRDAEEKLIRRLVENAERNSAQDIKVGSFMSFLVMGKETEVQQPLPHHHSTPSQVLPLASSPSAFRPLHKPNS